MIKNTNNDLYTGISASPISRKEDHNKNRGAAFTKNKFTFEIVYIEKYKTLSEARKREIKIKKWRREKKEFLIAKYNKI